MAETKMRQIRMSKGITAIFVAKKAGIDPAHYWRIETAYRGIQPRTKVLTKIAEALGVTINDLLEGVNE